MRYNRQGKFLSKQEMAGGQKQGGSMWVDKDNS